MIRYILILSAPLLALDQWTKWWIVQRFPEYGSPENLIEVIPGFFSLVRVHNTGMAFGLLNGYEHANWIFGAVGLAAVFVIAKLWSKGAFPDKIAKTAAALLVSGILGNLTDRVLPRRGYVVDFLDFKLPFYEWIDKSGHFPSFNIADSCITVAAALLLISSFRSPNGGKLRKRAQN